MFERTKGELGSIKVPPRNTTIALGNVNVVLQRCVVCYIIKVHLHVDF